MQASGKKPKKSAKSPTKSSLEKWRKAGYVCAIVEHWNPHVKIRQDLFGFIDVLAVGNGETVAIQTTTKHNLQSRLRKIEADEDKIYYALKELREAGWKIILEGWHKPAHRWEVEVLDIS